MSLPTPPGVSQVSAPARPRTFDAYHVLFTLGLGLLGIASGGGIWQLAAQGRLLNIRRDALPSVRELGDPSQLGKMIGQYRMATLIDPGAEQTWFNLAYLLVKAGEREDAARAYRRVLGLNPRRADAHAALGAIALDANRLPEAVDELKRAVTLDPNLGRAHNDLGYAHAGLGHLGEAVRHFEIATSLTGDPLTRANLERARAELSARAPAPPAKER